MYVYMYVYIQECKEEVIRVNEKLMDQQRKVAALQRQLDKHGELEEQKASSHYYYYELYCMCLSSNFKRSQANSYGTYIHTYICMYIHNNNTLCNAKQAQLEEYEQQHLKEIEDEQAKLEKDKELVQA